MGITRGPRRHWDLTRKTAGHLFECNSILGTISLSNKCKHISFHRKAKGYKQKQKAKNGFHSSQANQKVQ